MPAAELIEDAQEYGLRMSKKLFHSTPKSTKRLDELRTYELFIV